MAKTKKTLKFNMSAKGANGVGQIFSSAKRATQSEASFEGCKKSNFTTFPAILTHTT
jgi:hypothetical protein